MMMERLKRSLLFSHILIIQDSGSKGVGKRASHQFYGHWEPYGLATPRLAGVW